MVIFKNSFMLFIHSYRYFLPKTRFSSFIILSKTPVFNNRQTLIFLHYLENMWILIRQTPLAFIIAFSPVFKVYASNFLLENKCRTENTHNTLEVQDKVETFHSFIFAAWFIWRRNKSRFWTAIFLYYNCALNLFFLPLESIKRKVGFRVFSALISPRIWVVTLGYNCTCEQ